MVIDTLQFVPFRDNTVTNAEVSIAFDRFYMQRVTIEFAEDLDRIRGAGDFKDTAVPTLVMALQQGTSMFPIEEQRRIIRTGQR